MLPRSTVSDPEARSQRAAADANRNDVRAYVNVIQLTRGRAQCRLLRRHRGRGRTAHGAAARIIELEHDAVMRRVGRDRTGRGDEGGPGGVLVGVDRARDAGRWRRLAQTVRLVGSLAHQRSGLRRDPLRKLH